MFIRVEIDDEDIYVYGDDGKLSYHFREINDRDLFSKTMEEIFWLMCPYPIDNNTQIFISNRNTCSKIKEN